jgi:hypothetical protein
LRCGSRKTEAVDDEGDAAVLGAAEVPGGPGGPQGREDPGLDREGVSGLPELGGDLEAVVPGARAGGVRAGARSERERAPGGGTRAAARQEGSGDRAFKKLLGADRLSVAAKVQLVQQVAGEGPRAAALRAVGLARATWHYRVRHWQPYEARYPALRAPLERMARAHPE